MGKTMFVLKVCAPQNWGAQKMVERTESPLDQYLHGMDRDPIVRELRFLTDVQNTVPAMHEHQALKKNEHQVLTHPYNR
jgi:hypothetical protein